MKNLTVKCFVIGGLVFIYWIASLFISSLTGDRERLSEKTQEEVAESWSRAQSFIGPIVCVPVINEDSASKVPFHCLYVLPEKLDVAADVENEILHRGIYDASVYKTRIAGKGHFDLSDMKELAVTTGGKHVRYDWANAQIITAISDKRGLLEGMKFTIGQKETELNSYFYDYGNKMLCAPLPFTSDVAICQRVDLSEFVGNGSVQFAMESNLKGASALNIAPIGRNSEITIRGNCASPSFEGLTLPTDRTVTDTGFSATWKVNSLNRNDTAQEFYSVCRRIDFQNVGCKLLVVGGQYAQTDRVLKYAFFVILLSLLAIFVAEMYVGCEINLFNYLLIGAALVLFYLILLSFGEVIGFSAAYLVAVVMIIGLVSLYLKAIVRQNRVALAVTAFLTLIDVFIYILLSLESMSLLVGTVGLFVILAIAMYLSLNLKRRRPAELDDKSAE